MSPVLIKMGSLDTDMHTRRMLSKDEGRDHSNAVMSQGVPQTASKPQEGG